MMINNATRHDFSKQEYACDLTGCSFYFGGRGKTGNSARATLLGSNVLLFRLTETDGAIDVIITIPDGFSPTHYYRGRGTPDQLSKAAHLTYHGRPKRKKMSGEIHLVNNGFNRFSGASNKVAAPLSFSEDIGKYPLPICRIELCHQTDHVKPKSDIPNFFELHPGDIFFNTVEVHLARSGFLHSIASCSPSILKVADGLLGSIFIHSSMQLFYLDRLDRRPGLFPQALALQTQNYELVILATHEYKNSAYQVNALRYFHTEDYFRKLMSRNYLPHGGGWCVDMKSIEVQKPGFPNMSSLFK
ncbi:MAG: hypothetical protein ACKN9W_08295 [Methylococcus sp.]